MDNSMLPFKVFNEIPSDTIEENKILAWLKNAFSQLKSMIFKLPFGKSTNLSISLRGLSEDFLSEAGDFAASVCGVYSERWAVWSLINEMKKNNIEVTSSISESEKEAEQFGNKIKTAAAEERNFKNKPLGKGQVDFINKNLDGYKNKGIALGKRVFSEQITSLADSSFCSYEVIHSGASDAKESTADLKIIKKSENDMDEEYRYSLKAYMNTGQVTKGTTKDPFGILGLMIGKKSLAARGFAKNRGNVQADFNKAFGEDLSQMAKNSVAIYDWVDKRTEEIKTNKEVSPHGLTAPAQAKLEAAQNFGSEIIDLQNQYYIRLFDLAMKKKPEEAKRAVLQILDLEVDSYSVLITAGQDKHGQISTWKSCSPELKRLMDTPIDKVDIKIESTVAPISKINLASGLGRATGKKKLANTVLKVTFSIEGIEIYKVVGQMKQFGSVQYTTTCGNDTQKVHMDNPDVANFLDIDDAKSKSLVNKEMKKPGSTKTKKAKGSLSASRKKAKKTLSKVAKVRRQPSKVSKIAKADAAVLNKLFPTFEREKARDIANLKDKKQFEKDKKTMSFDQLKQKWVGIGKISKSKTSDADLKKIRDKNL